MLTLSRADGGQAAALPHPRNTRRAVSVPVWRVSCRRDHPYLFRTHGEKEQDGVNASFRDPQERRKPFPFRRCPNCLGRSVYRVCTAARRQAPAVSIVELALNPIQHVKSFFQKMAQCSRCREAPQGVKARILKLPRRSPHVSCFRQSGAAVCGATADLARGGGCSTLGVNRAMLGRIRPL